MPQELIFLSGSQASVADDTEVVPPKSNKQIQRSQHRSLPYPLIDDEPFFGCPFRLLRKPAHSRCGIVDCLGCALRAKANFDEYLILGHSESIGLKL